jgi:hypothetical protein
VQSGVTKYVAAERQLEAAFYLLLRGFPPEPIQTLIGAARGILYGLAKHRENPILQKWDSSVLMRVANGDARAARNLQNRVANFLKHADTDPEAVLQGGDLAAINEIELQLCIIALSVAHEKLSKRLDLAIWYLSLSPNAIIPFDALAGEYLHGLADFPFHKFTNRGELRTALLTFFEKA